MNFLMFLIHSHSITRLNIKQISYHTLLLFIQIKTWPWSILSLHSQRYQHTIKLTVTIVSISFCNIIILKIWHKPQHISYFYINYNITPIYLGSMQKITVITLSLVIVFLWYDPWWLKVVKSGNQTFFFIKFEFNNNFICFNRIIVHYLNHLVQ